MHGKDEAILRLMLEAIDKILRYTSDLAKLKADLEAILFYSPISIWLKFY